MKSAHPPVTSDKMTPGRLFMSIMMVPSSMSSTASVPAASAEVFELVRQRNSSVDDGLELVYCFLRRIREDRWDLALCELVNRFRCLVGIFFEGMDLVTGDIKKIFKEVTYIRAKKIINYVIISYFSSGYF